MMKSVDGNVLFLSRTLYFAIIEQLLPNTIDEIHENINDTQLSLSTSQLHLYRSQSPMPNKIDIEPESVSSSNDDRFRSSQISNSSDNTPIFQLVSPNEIKRLLAEITWAEIGDRTLTKNQLTGLVRDLVLPDDATDDETEITGDDAISDQSIVLLREMLKAAETKDLQLSHILYFNIINELC